ncbi:CRISPR-associated endonuclease Cas2 [Thermodesulfovibrio yellowstonii]|uniref:CRISPR-associated endoribonuclease Cas2 3 n=1 Tax=Thermodesulfovibrio yellowstonii (strain ATCC 51303 / DSM 11347 / YP87) TaxID=289376 RepID=CAS2C_THEYD|nr:CRISPR-associated endonuclease Cas2 [Thermodesulfovibrio yellowstonii]B5YIU7.1 RecName: Full=CRISPR-associated endoribonuclease Cas2 3 [Thermodesulfovibrio yellowstonii DSM 11347]ACI21703.1 CRISPR-associated protein Cas2 [Thermodesulfovibrio yellowstonii DSM 11347]
MPYLIVTYDIAEERVNKVRKILKKYFMWVQNSVFEGEITEGKLLKCKLELEKVIDKEVDSVYFYSLENRLNYRKTVLGIEKEITGNIL